MPLSYAGNLIPVPLEFPATSGLRCGSPVDKIKYPDTKIPAGVAVMATVTTDPDSDLAILSRLIRPERLGFSTSAARAILEIDFEASDRADERPRREGPIRNSDAS